MSYVFWSFWPSYHVLQFLPYNVQYLGFFWTSLPTLKSDVIYGRSLKWNYKRNTKLLALKNDEVQSFLFRYSLFLCYYWFFRNIKNSWRKYFGFLTNCSNENELSSSTGTYPVLLQIVGIDTQNFYLNFASIYNFHTDISVASTSPAMLSQLLQHFEYLECLD